MTLPPKDNSADEVLQLAQQRISERKVTTQEQAIAQTYSWRYAFLGLLGALLLILVLWPSTALNWKMYAVVHGVCAQVHNVDVGGVQLPLCARNTGIYASFTLTMIYMFALGRGRAARPPAWPISTVLVLFIVIMGIDGVNSLLRDLFLPHLYVPMNWLRTLTGSGMGISIAVGVLLILNLALRRNLDERTAPINSWAEFAGAVGLNLLLWAAIYGNVGLLYWPIALIAWVGIVGVLFFVNMLVTALFMRYENSIDRLGQLARPATIALVLTGIELGLLAWLRFALEMQGLSV